MQLIWGVQLANSYIHLRFHLDKIKLAAEGGMFSINNNNNVSNHRSFILAVQVLELTVGTQIVQGIVLGLLRQNEPLNTFIILRELRSWFGLTTPRDKSNTLTSTSTYSLMNQQLSTDLVYAILKTITERTDGEVKRKYKAYDFTNQNKFLIESMFVRDPEVFQVAKIQADTSQFEEVMEHLKFMQSMQEKEKP